MKRLLLFILIVFLAFLPGKVFSQTSYQNSTHSKKEESLNISQIKKEIKLIDMMELSSIRKIKPVIVKDIEFEVDHEVFFAETKEIKKIEAKISFPLGFVKEKYYFKNNILIAYSIDEYRQGHLAHSEYGYFKNFGELVLYINDVKSDPEKEILDILYERLETAINLYTSSLP